MSAKVATAEGACCPRGGFELEDPKREDPAAIELLLRGSEEGGSSCFCISTTSALDAD